MRGFDTYRGEEREARTRLVPESLIRKDPKREKTSRSLTSNGSMLLLSIGYQSMLEPFSFGSPVPVRAITGAPPLYSTDRTCFSASSHTGVAGVVGQQMDAIRPERQQTVPGCE